VTQANITRTGVYPYRRNKTH